jgi:hypothetical protein
MITTQKFIEDLREHLFEREDTLYGKLLINSADEIRAKYGEILNLQEWVSDYEKEHELN